ncbi:unnamed protein product [Malus baccata var. baccata]
MMKHLPNSKQSAKMVVFLLKLIFFTFSFISNLGFRTPGQAIHGTLQLVTEVIKSCSEYFAGLVMEAISATISTFFDFLKGSVTGFAGITTSAIVGLVEKTKTSLESVDGLLTDYREVSKGFSEMVYRIVNNTWNDFKDAFEYHKNEICIDFEIEKKKMLVYFLFLPLFMDTTARLKHVEICWKILTSPCCTEGVLQLVARALK